MTFKARKRLAILVLLVGLPVYAAAAVTVVGLFDRPPILVELLVYVGLGFLWILPLRRLFLGVARPDPGAGGATGERDPAGAAEAVSEPEETRR